MRLDGNTAHIQAKINGNASDEQQHIKDLLSAFDDAGYNDRQKISMLVVSLYDDDMRHEIIKILETNTPSDKYHPSKETAPVSRSFMSRQLSDFFGSFESMIKEHFGRIERQIQDIEVVSAQSPADQEAYIQRELDETEQRLREQLRNRRGGSVRDRRRQDNE